MDAMLQKNIFSKSEGDAWYLRNINSYRNGKSYLLDHLKINKIKPRKILELGCSHGHHLNLIQKEYDCEAYGVDPSDKAIQLGKELYPNINLSQGVASDLPFKKNYFDMIVYGFCLYLCDREDLFKIVYEGDRVLSENGFCLICDFQPSFPNKCEYHHYNGCVSFKMDYKKMFLSNPDYFLVSSCLKAHNNNDTIFNQNERVSIDVIAKGKSGDGYFNN